LVYFMSVYMVIKGYHEIKENEKILSVHKEIKVCRLWNNNLKVLNGKCLADGVKAGYFNEGKYDFPEYSDKEKKCREDFDSLKKDFKARICGNGKIYLLYLSAKTVSSEENAAGADSSEQDIDFCSFNADHPKSAQIFLKDISEKSKSALRELDLCYKENTGRF
ncbi:MAG: hypothetical protein J5706_09170, partial [Elusimicrobiales bacterium]|nr:hypothetical protein [Elusimicrobiales bacterium]